MKRFGFLAVLAAVLAIGIMTAAPDTSHATGAANVRSRAIQHWSKSPPGYADTLAITATTPDTIQLRFVADYIRVYNLSGTATDTAYAKPIGDTYPIPPGSGTGTGKFRTESSTAIPGAGTGRTGVPVLPDGKVPHLFQGWRAFNALHVVGKVAGTRLVIEYGVTTP